MNLLDKYQLVIEKIKKIDNVRAVILFGSYAENNIKPLSDIDICVIFNENATKKNKNEVLTYGNDELDISLFESLPLSLKFKILHNGKILYQTKSLINLKINITNQWFDFRVIANRLYKSRGFKGLEI